jgi:hypothetical protein
MEWRTFGRYQGYEHRDNDAKTNYKVNPYERLIPYPKAMVVLM